MSNPALSNNPALNGKTLTAEELHRIYDQPAAQMQRPGVDVPAAGPGETAAQQQPVMAPSAHPMTYENTISKTVMLFLVLLAFAAVGWFAHFLALPAAIAGLVLGIVNTVKKEPSVPLIFSYAAVQGVFLGGISGVLESQYSGIVSQAIIGTFSVFGVTLLLFRSGKVRTSPRATKIVMIAVAGYFVFSLVNFGMMMFGATSDPWGVYGMRLNFFGITLPVGVLIGVVAVLLAAYSLVMDFEMIHNGVKNRVPEKWGWAAAFGLMVTLIWLYLEILRILALLRGSD